MERIWVLLKGISHTKIYILSFTRSKPVWIYFFCGSQMKECFNCICLCNGVPNNIGLLWLSLYVHKKKHWDIFHIIFLLKVFFTEERKSNRLETAQGRLLRCFLLCLKLCSDLPRYSSKVGNFIMNSLFQDQIIWAIYIKLTIYQQLPPLCLFLFLIRNF